jgi:hypothetical protein
MPNNMPSPKQMMNWITDFDTMSEREILRCLMTMLVDMKQNTVTKDYVRKVVDKKCDMLNAKIEAKFGHIEKDLINVKTAMDDSAKHRNIVIRNLPETHGENVLNKVNYLIRDGLRLNLSVSSAERKKSYKDGLSGIIVAQLGTTENKRKVMDNKAKLQSSKMYSKIFIDHDKTKEQRDNEANFRELAKAVGSLRVKGNNVVSSQPSDSYNTGRSDRKRPDTRNGENHQTNQPQQRYPQHARGQQGEQRQRYPQRAHRQHGEQQQRYPQRAHVQHGEQQHHPERAQRQSGEQPHKYTQRAQGQHGQQGEQKQRYPQRAQGQSGEQQQQRAQGQHTEQLQQGDRSQRDIRSQAYRSQRGSTTQGSNRKQGDTRSQRDNNPQHWTSQKPSTSGNVMYDNDEYSSNDENIVIEGPPEIQYTGKGKNLPWKKVSNNPRGGHKY